MKNILFLILMSFLFSVSVIAQDNITKKEKEKMYQEALDIDFLTPWLKKIYGDSIKYCRGENEQSCSYMEANEYVDSSYTLYKKGIKLDIKPSSEITSKAIFFLQVKDVEQHENEYFFKIKYAWVCNPDKQETCIQVYGQFRFVKYKGEWKLCSRGVYEEVYYNRFTYIDEEVMKARKKRRSEIEKNKR